MKKTDVTVISEIVNASDEGLSSVAIYTALKKRMRDKVPSYRTFKRRLAALVEEGKIVRIGKARAAKYRSHVESPGLDAITGVAPYVPVSDESKTVQEYVRRPLQARKQIEYQRDFLEEYIPNHTVYLPDNIRRDLYLMGEIRESAPVGSTYHPETVNRLLIDLSWASSRLEGNTYSLIDTRNLFESGVFAEGKDRKEAMMILNHKRAIEMLLEGAQDIDFNMYTFLSLHGLLSENLMGDPQDCGRLRQKIVEIGGSVYRPLGFPQQVEDYFRLFLDKARDIEDPFEQAFFAMVHIPYLQPFTDVNKRTARLGANIPLIKNKLCPLSFIDVPGRDYIEGYLGVYELTQTSLLQDVFVWAYEQSCRQYNVIKDHSAEPDPFRFKYTSLLHSVIGQIIRNRLDGTDACITGLAQGQVPDEETGEFISLVNAELENLHEGHLRRYRVSLDEFNAWKQGRSDPGERPGPQ